MTGVDSFGEPSSAASLPHIGDSNRGDGNLWQDAACCKSKPTISRSEGETESPTLEGSVQRPEGARVIPPDPQVLYDHTDDFFAKLNLDEPVIESTPSPTSAEICPPMNPNHRTVAVSRTNLA